MPRRTDQYRCQPLAAFAGQLSYVKAERLQRYLEQAEALHDGIDEEQTYPLSFVVFRISGYRPKQVEDPLLVGAAVRPDLRLLIDQLSQRLNEPIRSSDATVDALAEKLSVSTRTLHRWRDEGLRWRWARQHEHVKKVVVFPEDALADFDRRHPGRLNRARQHTWIDASGKQRLLDRARRLVQERPDLTRHRVAEHLAKRTGRAVETIRLILEKHDQEHPDRAIFVKHRPPLSDRQQRVIARAMQRGIPTRLIGERFNRGRSVLYRAANVVRRREAMTMDLTHQSTPIFEREDASEVILGRVLPTLEISASDGAPPLPDPLGSLYQAQTPDEDTLHHALVQLNFLLFQACQMRDALDPSHPRTRALQAFASKLTQSQQVRSWIVSACLPAVLSVARQQLAGETRTASTPKLFALLPEGHRVLYAAISSYDPRRRTAFVPPLRTRLATHFATVLAAQEDKATRRVEPDALHRQLKRDAEQHGVTLPGPTITPEK